MSAKETQYGRVPYQPIAAGTLAQLSGTETKVYLAILAHVNGASWTTYITPTRIAALTGLHKRTVQKADNSLCERGLISMREGGGRGRANAYTVVIKGGPQTPPIESKGWSPDAIVCAVKGGVSTPKGWPLETTPTKSTKRERESTPSESTRSKHAGKAKPASVEAVIEFGESINLVATECRKFWDYYESNGWKVGKNPMQKWKSSLQNWKRRADDQRRDDPDEVPFKTRSPEDIMRAALAEDGPYEAWPPGRLPQNDLERRYCAGFERQEAREKVRQEAAAVGGAP
jgi:hypothetical protein